MRSATASTRKRQGRGLALALALASTALPACGSGNNPSPDGVGPGTIDASAAREDALASLGSEALDLAFDDGPTVIEALVDGGAIEGGAGDGAGASGIQVSVACGESPGTAEIEVVPANSGDAIASLAVSVLPDNVSASGSGAALSVAGLVAQTTHTFVVTATTAAGTRLSATTAPLAFYDVVATFLEPECASNTRFAGTFTFDGRGEVVSNLKGTLSEAMVDGAPTIPLMYQLWAEPVALGGDPGQLVATFALATTDTWAGGGFAPGGSISLGNHNAYALVFVNAADPASPATADQLARLAYADCTAKGLMGKTCMTGISTTTYGHAGTMGAYPISQVTTQR